MKKKQTLKKVLVILLCTAVAVTYMPLSDYTFATEGGSNTDVVQEVDNGEQPVTEQPDDKEEPPVVEKKTEEQATPKAEPESEGEEPGGPVNSPKSRSETTHTNLDDYLGTTPPLMVISLTHEDGRPITEDDPLVTGEKAIFFMEVEESYPSMVFDMDSLTYQFPEGLYLGQPKTESNTIYVEDYSGNPQALVNTYTINEDAFFTYTWNTENENLYELACAAKNKGFAISNSLTIDDSTTLIDFGHGITYPVDNTGKLTVTKSVTGVSSMTEAQMKAMTFRVIDKATGQVPKDKDGNTREDCTFSLFDMTGSNLANKTYEILKLPPGEYTIEEVGHPNIDGYSFMASSSTTTDDATVHGGQGTTVNLSNVYAQDFGHLKLKKLFGEGSDLNDSNLTPEQKDKITFTVVGPNGPVTGSPFKYSQFTNGELDLGNLPIGTYTVTESANIEGYNRTTTYQVNNDSGASGVAAEVDVAKGDNDVVTYTNSYEEKKGHLKIKKTFSGAGADRIPAEEKKKVTFTVTGPNGYSRTFTYADFDADGEKDLGEVLTGTYKITESKADFPDYSVTRTTTITGADSTSGLTATSIVTEGTLDFPVFDNSYEEVGTLVITKNITGAYGNSSNTVKSGTSFTLQRKNSAGTWTNVSPYVDIKANNTTYFTLVGGVLTCTIPNLPAGEYRVTESPYNNNNYVRTTTVTANGTTNEGVLVGYDTVEYDQSSTIAFENNYKRKQGKIIINKKIFVDGREIDLATATAAELAEMGLTEEKQKAMKFTVKLGNNTTKTISLWDILQGNNVVTVDTSTTNYTVTESGADFNDAYMRETLKALDNGTPSSGMTVSGIQIRNDGDSHTAEFTNKYKKSGSIRLFKDITGGLNSADRDKVRQQLRFKIKNKATGEYVLDTSDNDYVFTLAQITAEAGIEVPVGTYVIEELYYEYKTDEYDVTVESHLTDESVTFGDDVSPDVGVTYGFQSYVYYENRYVKGPGPGVTVEKYVILNGVPVDETVTDEVILAFENAVKDQIKFRIVSTEKDDNGNPVYDHTYTYRELEGNTVMLPPGEYTITELDYQMTGYNHNIYFKVNGQTVTSTSAKFTVTKTTPLGIEVYNGYVEIGNLIIKKTFAAGSDITAANITPDQKTKIIFTVTGYKSKQNDTVIFPTETFNYNQMTDGQKVFNNIPAGYYVVTETAELDKYTWTYEWSEGTTDVQVIRGQTAEKSVENKYVRQKGNLKVIKTLDGDSLDPERSDLPNVTFTVRNKDANTPEFSKTFKYSEMTVDTNGKRYKTYTVPTGEYVVTETNADFGYYIRTSTVKVGTGSSEPYDETNGATGTVTYNQTTNIEITNKYEEAGHLIFKKTFNDDACITKLTAAQKKRIKFTVYEGTATTPYAEFTYADFDSETDSYTLLVRPDTEYTVKETRADIEGYVRVTTVKVGSGPDAAYNEQTGASAQVAVFTDKEVAFTNTYEERGKLKVTKTISGITEALTDEQKAAIQFTVKDPQGNILKNEEGEEIGRFTFADISTGGYTGSITFDNLPAGTYTVSETVNDNAFYGRNRTTTVKVGNGAPQQGESAEAVVNLKGQQVAFTNSYDDADRLNVVKSDGGYPKGVGFITIDGTKYPYWMFTLTIDNLTPETTDNGVVDLTDVYDKKLTGLFRVLTTAQAEAANIPGAANANKLVPVGSGTAADVTLQPDYDNGKVVFHISGVDANTATTNKLTYYLVPKDADALGQLNTSDELDESTESMTILKKFSNIVNYKPLPKLDEVSSNEVEYMYEHTNFSKECINYNAEKKEFFNPDDPDGPPVYYALYEIIINPDGLRIGTEDYVDVTDTFSTNQSVNMDTVVFKRYDNSTTPPTITDTEEGDIVDPHMQGHSLKFKLKNELAIRLTYRSQIAVSSADVGKPMVIENTLKVAGKEVTVTPDIIPDGTGHGSVVQIKLLKTEDKNFNNRLAGAEFKLYRDVDQSEQQDKQLLNPDTTPGPGTFTTDANGEIVIRKYIEDGTEQPVIASKANHVTYFLEEVNPPQGYEPLGYVLHCRLADVQHGETFDYDEYVYLPVNDSVNVKNTPKKVTYSLGALKDFETHESDRKLEPGEFTFKLQAVDDSPMPAGASGGIITQSNDADGKAVFGSVTLDYEDIVTRDENGVATEPVEKTYTYTITEQPPAGGVDENGNKDGVHYDLAPKTVTVTISWNDTKNDFDVNVTGASLDSSNNVHFVEVDNEYTAQGTWTPNIQKNLQGRTLEAGEFTFQIKKGDTVLATGTNNADGTVTMDPANLTFTLADLGVNNLTVHEVYTVQTDDGIYSTAADETVKVTVAEKQDSEGKPVYDGKLNVTSDKATLTAPLVMTNKFRASGSWNPKAKKVMSGALKINAGDYSFELAGVKDADGNLPPMPSGSTNGKKELACDANGKVDFGQIDFYQGTFDNVKYNDGDKEFHYTIQEVIPEDPEDRIFGVVYDDTVYNITVKTKINKTNKLEVTVTCDPATGWNLDESTATFTGMFKNTYNPKPGTATPEYKKTIAGEKPSEDVTFEFKLEKAEDNTGDFDYVKVNGSSFADQTKTLTLGPDTVVDSGVFDEITFLAEGTYKFKITETPITTQGVLDPHIDFDPKEYTYTVVVKGNIPENRLIATGTYSNAGQTADTAAFTNPYTPEPVDVPLDVKKTMTGTPIPDGHSYSFDFNLTAEDAASPPPEKTSVTVVVPDSPTASFGNIHFTSAGEYTYTVQEVEGVEPGVTYDTTPKTVTITVTDVHGVLEAKVDGAELNDDDAYEVEIINNLGLGSLKISKTVDGKNGDKNKKFAFMVALSVDGNYPYTIYTKTGAEIGSGEIKNDGTILLAHDQYAIISNLPEGTKYTVTEIDSGEYTVSYTGEKGIIEADSTAEVAVVNTPPDNPDTGDHTPLLLYLLLAQLSLIGLLFLFLRRRRTA